MGCCGSKNENDDIEMDEDIRKQLVYTIEDPGELS